MYVEYSEFEIFVITVAIGVTLQGCDLAIDCLQLAGADGMIVPVENERLPYQ